MKSALGIWKLDVSVSLMKLSVISLPREIGNPAHCHGCYGLSSADARSMLRWCHWPHDWTSCGHVECCRKGVGNAVYLVVNPAK